MAIGVREDEENVPFKIKELLEIHNPNILVITGHDAYYKKKGDKNDLLAYKNSQNFISSIKEARKYEHSHEKLIIILLGNKQRANILNAKLKKKMPDMNMATHDF